MSLEITGTVKLIPAEQQVSASFKKRELVITTDGQYPEPIIIEFVQDKTDLLKSLRIGDEVKVSINLGGREWVNPQGETKYFNSIKGWRIEKQQSAPANNSPASNEQSFAPATNFNEEDHDDMPF